MPWTSPSRSTVMIVTPVAKAPMAFRNSLGLKVIVVETLLATSLSPHLQRSRPRRSKLRLYNCTEPTDATAYITTAARCIIRVSVAVSPIKPAGRDHFQDLLGDVRPGKPISRDAAVHLIRCGDQDLPELLAAARAAKERFKPSVITYSRKVFIPLTNLCRDYCGYCIFRRDPGQPGAHTMTPDEVLEVVRKGEKLGCTEALFSLGDKPELIFPEMRETLRRLGYRSTLHYLEAMCALVLRETSLLTHPNPGLMSPEWIA